MLFEVVGACVLRKDDFGVQRVNILLRLDDFQTDVLELCGKLLTFFRELCAASRHRIDLFLGCRYFEVQLRQLFTRFLSALLELTDFVEAGVYFVFGIIYNFPCVVDFIFAGTLLRLQADKLLLLIGKLRTCAEQLRFYRRVFTVELFRQFFGGFRLAD